MSLLVGKRNYTELFGASQMPRFGDLQGENGKYFKLNTNQSHSGSSTLGKSVFQKNLEALKGIYSNVDEKELLSALDDCDNNLDLAKEVINTLKKDQYTGFEEVKERQTEGTMRNVRSLKGQASQPNKLQSQKTEMMDECVEKKTPTSKMNQETVCKELATYLISGMKNSGSFEQACEFLYTSLKSHLDARDKKQEAELKKQKDEKLIMIRSFQKLRERNKNLAESSAEQKSLAEEYEKEVDRLKSTNYKLALMLRSIDTQNVDNFSNEIY